MRIFGCIRRIYGMKILKCFLLKVDLCLNYLRIWKMFKFEVFKKKSFYLFKGIKMKLN